MRKALIGLALVLLGVQAAWAADSEAAPSQILVTFRQAQVAAQPHTGARSKYFSPTSDYATSVKVDRDVRAIAREQGLRPVDAWPIAPLGVHCVVFELTGPRPMDDVVKALASDPRVESVQPMQIFDVLATELHDGPDAGAANGH